MTPPTTPISNPTPSPRLEEMDQLLEHFGQITEQLQASHDRLQQEVVRLQTELAAKNRMLARKKRLALLGEMAAGVAHEIRNPLGGIRLYGSLLAREVEGNETLDPLVQPILRATEALDHIVAGLLDYTADRTPTLHEVDPKALFEEAIAHARSELDSGEVELVRDYGGAPESAQVDPELLRRVLLNLLLNALQALPEGQGRITLGVESTGDGCLAFTIHDNGRGIPVEEIEKVFHPFYTNRTGGTGLGLPICHRIVQAHHGQIELESEPGTGTRVRVTIPVAPPDPTEPEPIGS